MRAQARAKRDNLHEQHRPITLWAVGLENWGFLQTNIRTYIVSDSQLNTAQL